MKAERLRSGLFGRLMSVDGRQDIAVLYSLDGHASRGRLRPQEPDGVFPAWLVAGATFKLHLHDGTALTVDITLVKLSRPEWKGDDHFAEFVVRPVTH